MTSDWDNPRPKSYFAELCRAMEMMAGLPNAVIMGQAVACDGTAMRKTLLGVPPDKLLEVPVAEDMQMGMATGMAMAGLLPICVYPRINFLLLATNQLVLHLDKLPLYSGYRPRVIIRTAVATDQPLDPGPQHVGDFSHALNDMMKTVYVKRLHRAGDIVPAYAMAIERPQSTILIEYMGHYA